MLERTDSVGALASAVGQRAQALTLPMAQSHPACISLPRLTSKLTYFFFALIVVHPGETQMAQLTNVERNTKTWEVYGVHRSS